MLGMCAYKSRFLFVVLHHDSSIHILRSADGHWQAQSLQAIVIRLRCGRSAVVCNRIQ